MINVGETLMMQNAELFPFIISKLTDTNSITISLKGFSMNPWLVGGRDRAVITRFKPNELKVGDVVLAELSPGRFALHRLVYVSETEVQMMGDGNLTPDPVVPMSSVKAKVVGFYRKGSDKMQPTDGTAFKVYSYLWLHLRPVRRLLLAFYRHIIMSKEYRDFNKG